MFWNDESNPSVEAPLGDFFGVANGQVRPIRSLAFTVNPGFYISTNASWGFNCYLPMPFHSGARIELENQGDVESRIWYHIDYELHNKVPSELEKAGLLHARWHREYPTLVHPPEGADEEAPEEWKNLSGKDNYVILDIEGDGQFAGYFLTVVNKDRSWWGEGDDMVFIDGEEFPPSIHGTGTEEIFGGGASPIDEYSGPYTGFHCIENRAGYEWWGTTGMYRFYINDPLRFRKSIRVTLEHGHANNLENDYCNVAFWYQYEPHKELPDLPPLEERRINFQW